MATPLYGSQIYGDSTGSYFVEGGMGQTREENLGFDSYTGAPSNSTEELALAQHYLSPSDFTAFQRAKYNVEQRHDLGQFNDQLNFLIEKRRQIKMATQTDQKLHPELFDASGKLAEISGQPTKAETDAAAAAKAKALNTPLTVGLIASRGGGTVAGGESRPQSFEEIATQSLVDEANRVRSPDFWAKADAARQQARDKFDQDTQTLITMAQNDPSVMSLLQLSKGEGPAADAAKAALRSGLDAANNMAMSQAASARGGAGAKALAMREAVAAGAQATQRAANQSQALLAQMSMQGIQGLTQQRAENMRMYGDIASKRADIGNTQAGQISGETGTSSQLAQSALTGAYNIPLTTARTNASTAVGTSGIPAPTPVPSQSDIYSIGSGVIKGITDYASKAFPSTPEPAATKLTPEVSGGGTTEAPVQRPERQAFNPLGSR